MFDKIGSLFMPSCTPARREITQVLRRWEEGGRDALSSLRHTDYTGDANNTLRCRLELAGHRHFFAFTA